MWYVACVEGEVTGRYISGVVTATQAAEKLASWRGLPAGTVLGVLTSDQHDENRFRSANTPLKHEPVHITIE